MDILPTSDLAGFMGQTLLNPPSVEGWHEGTEWINSGALVERVNFAAKEISNIDAPGVRVILDRLAEQNGAEYTPAEIVDACLDIMGTPEMDIEMRAALIAHVGIKGDISLTGGEKGGVCEQRICELLGLIASTTEYQLV